MAYFYLNGIACLNASHIKKGGHFPRMTAPHECLSPPMHPWGAPDAVARHGHPLTICLLQAALRQPAAAAASERDLRPLRLSGPAGHRCRDESSGALVDRMFKGAVAVPRPGGGRGWSSSALDMPGRSKYFFGSCHLWNVSSTSGENQQEGRGMHSELFLKGFPFKNWVCC